MSRRHPTALVLTRGFFAFRRRLDFWLDFAVFQDLAPPSTFRATPSEGWQNVHS
jgi:hypothetical protein